MKNKPIWIAGALAVLLTTECKAQLSRCDDFNDNSKDTNRWGPDVQGCGGLLTETNGRLEFTKSSGCSSDLVLRPWILNFGSYTQDWKVQMDVSVPDPGFGESSFSVGVISGTNVDFNNPDSDAYNRLSLHLFQSATESRVFFMRFGVKGSTAYPRVCQVYTASTFAGLQIAFDASTKVLSTFYDEDGPNNGYSWTLLCSTNISTAWSLTSTSVFTVFVSGRAEADVVASTDNLFGDNFCASSAPRLGINPGIGAMVLTWSTNASGYHLQSASALTPPMNWQSVTNAPGIVGSNFAVTNTVSSSKAFYRLGR